MKIKICGIYRIEDTEIINEFIPDYAGFVFFPASHRFVTDVFAEDLRKHIDKRVKTVGVFVDDNIEHIADLYNKNIIDTVQLHGHENEEYIKKLKARMPHAEIWQAFLIRSDHDLIKAQESSADKIILDNGYGSGKCFDWSLIGKVRRDFILAGGITADNIEEAIRRFSPYMIDVSSGVETNKVKDKKKTAAVIAAIKRTGCDKMSYGRFGIHGGQYIPETLMNAVIELENAYNRYKNDAEFNKELTNLLNEYAGRPSRLYYAEKMTKELGGAKIYLKREDLNHTGAHKINNVLGQALLAKKMGKSRLIAETGAGQHGVATATAAALMGMECVVFMGRKDTERQALNVYRMRLLGAEVVPVTTGTETLKDAVSEAMREWTSRIDDTHYCLGSVMGPHPFPTIVRDFQSVISKEIKAQLAEKEGQLPNAVIACVGGGSNAIGSFYNFLEDKSVRLIGCEAAGRGVDTFETAATLNTGRVGIFHGMKSYFCQDEYGQIAPVYSISAGLDYPGVGPEHAYLHDIGRAEYVPVTDEEAVNAFEYLSKTEGIIPAIESAHAVAYAMKLAPTMSAEKIIVITISGRGDKDCAAIARYRGENIYE